CAWRAHGNRASTRAAPGRCSTAFAWEFLLLRSGWSKQVQHRVGERSWCFLRQVMADPLDDAMRPASSKPCRAGLAVRGWDNAVCITVQGDCRHGNRWQRGKSVLDLPIAGEPIRQTHPVTIRMDHDVHEIRIVEGFDAALERRIVECPGR